MLRGGPKRMGVRKREGVERKSVRKIREETALQEKGGAADRREKTSGQFRKPPWKTRDQPETVAGQAKASAIGTKAHRFLARGEKKE